MLRLRIWLSALPPALRLLLLVNVVAYLAWILIVSHVGPARNFVWDHLALNASWNRVLVEPWQLLTYGFLHLGESGLSSLLHVGFNMLWLYWIGREFEETYGGQQLMAVYLLASPGGALLSIIAYGIIGGDPVIVHGASASVLGVITMVAVRFPQRRIWLLFFGSVRLRVLVVVFLALDILFGFGGNTAVAAHVGGALTGLAFVRLEGRGVDLSSWTHAIISPRRVRHSPRVFGRLEERLSGKKAPDLSVDDILDKISEQGIDSLTRAERAVLERASERKD